MIIIARLIINAEKKQCSGGNHAVLNFNENDVDPLVMVMLRRENLGEVIKDEERRREIVAIEYF